MKLSSIVKGVAAGLFVLSLPVLFGTTSLRWLVSDDASYITGAVIPINGGIYM